MHHVLSLACRTAVVAAFVCGALAFQTSPALALECGRYEAVTKLLDSRYQESRKAMGLVSTRGVMELFVSDAGTWTVLLTAPNGIACIVAAGDSWDDVPAIQDDPAA